jgi:hypothetical protein
MSHKHNPPRLSPLGKSRKPRTELQRTYDVRGRHMVAKSKANAAFNKSAQKSNEPGKPTAGQLVAAGIITGQ